MASNSGDGSFCLKIHQQPQQYIVAAVDGFMRFIKWGIFVQLPL